MDVIELVEQKAETMYSGWDVLAKRLRRAAGLYSNVHRGAGQYSLASTRLFEQARQVVRDVLGLDAKQYQVIFCTPASAEALTAGLPAGSYRLLSSASLGLGLGVRALAVRRSALPEGKPAITGGGTVRLVSRNWAIWDGAPERFEAGTPAVLNVAIFALALQLTRRYGAENLRPARTARVEEILYEDQLSGLEGQELLNCLRAARMDQDVLVPTDSGLRSFVFLDNAASTPTFEPVVTAALQAMTLDEADRSALAAEVRGLCAEFFGAPEEQYELLFTANTTAAINLVAHSLARETAGGARPLVLSSLLEHNSNELPWRCAAGAQVLHLKVDGRGMIDLTQMEAALQNWNVRSRAGGRRIRLVALSGASNVLGSFNPIADAARLAHRYGARILVDAAQLAAHRRISLLESGVDFLVCSAHKMYAPFGSGLLIFRRGMLRFTPAELLALRAAGEENSAGLAALGKAIWLLERIGLDQIEAEERRLTERLLNGLARISGAQVMGLSDPHDNAMTERGPVVAMRLAGVPHNLAAEELAQTGIGTRSGCFCSHLLVKDLLRIHPLRARLADAGMLIVPAFTAPILPGLLRVSLGLENTAEDVDRLLEELQRIARQPRPAIIRWLGKLGNGSRWLPVNETSAAMEEYSARFAENFFEEIPTHGE